MFIPDYRRTIVRRINHGFKGVLRLKLIKSKITKLKKISGRERPRTYFSAGFYRLREQVRISGGGVN